MDISVLNTINLNETESEEEQRIIIRHARIISVVFTTVPYILLVFGIPGNLLSIAVLSRRTMMDSMFSVYLISLCSFNIFTMSVNLPMFITYGETGREMTFDSDYMCMLFRLLSVTLIVITNWHLVVITAARLAFVLDRKKTSAVYKHNPLHSIFVICLISIVMELPIVIFWVRFSNADKSMSVPRIECFLPGTSPFVYVQITIQGFLPAALLVILNALIFLLHYRKDSGMVASQHSVRMLKHLALLAFLSSLQFVITVIPLCILYPGRKKLFDLSKPTGRSKENLAFSLALMCIHFNYSSNFLVYCFFGRRFRNELCKLLSGTLKPLCPGDFLEPRSYLSSTSASEISRNRTEVSEALSDAPGSDTLDQKNFTKKDDRKKDEPKKDDPRKDDPTRDDPKNNPISMVRANSLGIKSTASDKTLQSASSQKSINLGLLTVPKSSWIPELGIKRSLDNGRQRIEREVSL